MNSDSGPYDPIVAAMDAHLRAIASTARADTTEPVEDSAERRRIALDTETTGFGIHNGHRVIEIGCVELIGRRLTGCEFHRYLNPDKASDPRALAIHGIRDAFLIGKPRFSDIVDEWIAFIEGAELLIHNAPFDTSFLDAELCSAGEHYGRVADHAVIVDTAAVARDMYPGESNALDALCKHVGVDNSHRKAHGALIDARLLGVVWLAMTKNLRESELATSITRAAGDTQPVRGTRRPRRTTRLNAGQPWLPAEEQQLVQQMTKGKPIRELAKLHQRSSKAIRARLKRLASAKPRS